MPKCPYCKAELELKLDIKPVSINDNFRKDLVDTNADIANLNIQIQKELLETFPGPGFLKGMQRRMLDSNWTKRMLDWSIRRMEIFLSKWAALPVLYQTCKNCDTVINTEIMMDLIQADNSSHHD